MKEHKMNLKSLKIDAVRESRQGVLAIANYTFTVARAKLVAARNLRIKRKVEQPEPTRCSENPFLLQQNYAVLTHWRTKT